MKKPLLLVTLLFMTFFMFGQQSKQKHPLPLVKYNENVNAPLTAKERAQIIEAYGDSAEKLVFSQPHRVKSIKNILRNRVEVVQLMGEKYKKGYPKLSKLVVENGLSPVLVSTFNPDDFNPLMYGFNFYSRAGMKTYHVDNTNYYIIIKSQYQ